MQPLHTVPYVEWIDHYKRNSIVDECIEGYIDEVVNSLNHQYKQTLIESLIQ